MPLVVLGLTPGVLLVTLTITVQLPEAGMVNPLKLSAACPAENKLLPAPAQVPVAAPGVATLMLTRLSVNVLLVIGLTLLLVSVNVSVVLPPEAMGLVPKALAMVGTLTTTRSAVVGSGLVLPSNVVSAPIGMVLV